MQDLNIQDEGVGQRPDVQSLQWRDGPGLGLDMQDVCVWSTWVWSQGL